MFESTSIAPKQLETVLHRLEETFRHIDDLQTFVQGLQSLLRGHPLLRNSCIQLLDTPGFDASLESDFRRRQLVLPLTGREGLSGLLKIPDTRPSSPLGPENLHLLSALAALAGVLIDRARRIQRTESELAMLQFLLDQVPLGIVAEIPGRESLYCNRVAEDWFAGSGERRTVEMAIRQAARETAGSRRLNVGSRTLHITIHRFQPSDGSSAFPVACLFDLADEQNRVRQRLGQDSYRCLWLGRPLSLLLIRCPDHHPEEDLFATMGDLRSTLPPAATLGPLGPGTLALLFPETTGHASRQWLRDRYDILPPIDLEIGMSCLREESDPAEGLIRDATARLQPIQSFLRRTLLLVDDYGPVNDTLEWILNHRFSIRKTVRFEEAADILSREAIDGLFTERFLARGRHGEELDAIGRKHNPGLRTFYSSMDPCPHNFLESRPPDSYYLQKPFDLPVLRSMLETAWNA